MSIKKYFPRNTLPPDQAAEMLAHFIKDSHRSWFLDFEGDYRITLTACGEKSVSQKSSLQEIDFLDTEYLGWMLILDGQTQFGEKDEWIYHEMLVHPAFVIHGCPQKVAILGGGDGCAVREIVKWGSVREIKLCDIDKEVTELFKNKYAQINRNSLAKVAEICYEDAREFLNKQNDKYFDIIISDLTEPFFETEEKASLSAHLYQAEFYDLVKSKLASGGLLVVQTGGFDHRDEFNQFHALMLKEISCVFHHFYPAYEYVPSFISWWSVTIASERELPIFDIAVDEILRKNHITGLKYYDQISHRRIFSYPKNIREYLAGKGIILKKYNL
jgi:spermidine synthase